MSGALVAVATLAGGTSGDFPDGTVLFQTPVNFNGAWQFLIPSGVAFVWILGWGPGGVGSNSIGKTIVAGPGGGAGALFKTHTAITAGIILAGVVGAAGYQGAGGPVASTATTLNANAGLALAACTANGGGYGVYGGAAGAGGTAAGGSVSNTTGHAGGLTNVWDGGGAPPGLVDNTVAGSVALTPGGGAPGGYPLNPGGWGQIQIIAKSA